MKRLEVSRRVVAVAFAFAFGVASTGACVTDRTSFGANQTFAPDAADAPDAPDCRLQCSLDGRSVIEACTGTVVEACTAEFACGAAKCQEPCAAAAADRSSNGCDFYFQMPRMDKWLVTGSCHAAFIVNTSTVPANVSLERQGEELDISKSLYRTAPGSASMIPHVGAIAPGESAVLFLFDTPGTTSFTYSPCPKEVTIVTTEDTVPHRTGFGSSFRLKSDVPVALTSMFPFGGATSYYPSATLVLPVATWSSEHMIVNAGGNGIGGGSPAVQIVASEDDTEVTIRPKVDLEDGSGVTGALANQSATFRLSRGQHLQLVQGTELTGSIVTSNKPTSLFGGSTCLNVPARATACDAASQQIPALAQWGSEYVGVGYRPRLGNEHEPVPYRIVAARDGTRLDYDPAIPPGAPTTMSAGEVAEFRSGTSDAFVVRTQDSEHPIYVAAYMTGGDGQSPTGHGGRGDAEFVNVVAAAQYLNAYSFYADPTYSETSLVLVRRKTLGEFKKVWLDCAGDLPKWTPIGTRGEYEFTRVDLSRGLGPGDTFGEGADATVCQSGLQRIRSDGPFTATLWGWDTYASYAYPGGMAQRKLVEKPFAPVN